MLTLHVEATGHADLLNKVAQELGVTFEIATVGRKDVGAIAELIAKAPAPAAPEPTPPQAPTESTPAALPAPAPRATRGRRAAAPVPPAPVASPALPAAQPAAPAAPVVTPPVTPVAAGPVPTVDQCREAMKPVNEKFGMPACVELLQKHGADRASTIPDASRAQFIKDCAAKVA